MNTLPRDSYATGRSAFGVAHDARFTSRMRDDRDYRSEGARVADNLRHARNREGNRKSSLLESALVFFNLPR